jgi:hypothetical protein
METEFKVNELMRERTDSAVGEVQARDTGDRWQSGDIADDIPSLGDFPSETRDYPNIVPDPYPDDTDKGAELPGTGVPESPYTKPDGPPKKSTD